MPSGDLLSAASPSPGYGTTISVFASEMAGVVTTIYSQRLTQSTDATIEFLATDVGATPGPNTIEFVRTGPAGADHLLLGGVRRRSTGTGGTGKYAPVSHGGGYSIPEPSPWSKNLVATGR